jgi:hypothetical protein
MKLRQRVITREKYDELVASDESSEDDSDESDNWVMPNSRKNRTIKRRKINPVQPNSSKKQHTSEAVRLFYNILFGAQMPLLIFTTYPFFSIFTPITVSAPIVEHFLSHRFLPETCGA